MNDDIWWALWLLLLYFLPGVAAKIRGHHQADAILLLNLLLGWTGLGWVAAAVWAATAVKKAAPKPGREDFDTRACPHCAETIKRMATVCKHCQREVKTL